jgi:Holliday junction resolvase RusA-like endonuclease
MQELNHYIDGSFPNWNEYINAERTNKYKANKIKQDEKRLIMSQDIPKYTGKYPVEITFNVHFKNRRKDLDNFRYKGILDGLVTKGVLTNDNLNNVSKITLNAIVDGTEGVELNIKEYRSEKQ